MRRGVCVMMALGWLGLVWQAVSVVNPTHPAAITSVAAKENTPPEPAGPPQIATKWPQPDAVLMLTAEQDGYLEPCGCSLTQSGGVSRRNDLLNLLKARNWPVAGLDAGNLVKRSRRQDQIKFEAIQSALKLMNYQATALGPNDLRLTPDFLLTQQPTTPEEAAKTLVMESSNVTFFDSPDLGTPVRTKTFMLGNVKVSTTAVLGKSRNDEVAPAGAANNITLSDPMAALAAAIDKIKAEKPQVLVLLCNGTTAEAREYAKKFPFQLIVATGGPEDPEPRPLVEGKTWIIQPGHKGKYVVLIGYFPNDAKEPFRYELVDLDNRRFKATQVMEDLMRDYQQRLQDEQISLAPDLIIPHPSGHKFVGSETCGECHAKAFEKWKETGHAKAFKSIKEGRGGIKGKYISRIHDPECLSCHVTGWEPQQMLRFDSGYRDEVSSVALYGNGCENCHGPGSAHVAIENGTLVGGNADAERARMRVTLAQAKKSLCYNCHDGDNSPEFKFDPYWEKIAHPWKD